MRAKSHHREAREHHRAQGRFQASLMGSALPIEMVGPKTLVAGLEAPATACLSNDRMGELREGELVKLPECGVFVRDQGGLARGLRWVVPEHRAEVKTRLGGLEAQERAGGHRALLESLATVYNLGRVVLGVASVCLRAPEESIGFMKPPEELVTLIGGSERNTRRMRRALYGMQTAGASWRDWPTFAD